MKGNSNGHFGINTKQPHSIPQSNPHNYIAITIKGGLDNAVFHSVIKPNKCVDLFYQLFHTLKNNTICSINQKWNNLYVYLLNNYISSASIINEEFIKNSIDFIQANYQHQLLVDDIARHACMSTYHFCRLFKKLTGLSPHNYLRQYRLSQSYIQLQKGVSVFDTAIQSGFYDSSHFIKSFHTYMAVSPKQYLQSLNKQ